MLFHPVFSWDPGSSVLPPCWALRKRHGPGPDKGNGEVEKVLKETQKQAEKAKEKVEAVPLVCQEVMSEKTMRVQWKGVIGGFLPKEFHIQGDW